MWDLARHKYTEEDWDKIQRLSEEVLGLYEYEYSPKYSRKFLEEAIGLATDFHAGQTRKYNSEPYILHPLRVAKEIKNFVNRHPLLGATAVCHDLLEDTEVLPVELVSLDPDLFYGVWFLTSPDKESKMYGKSFLKREIRKTHQIIKVAAAPAEIQIIKIFDRLDNLQPDQHLPHDRDFLKLYLDETKELYDSLWQSNSWEESLSVPMARLFQRIEEVEEKLSATENSSSD